MMIASVSRSMKQGRSRELELQHLSLADAHITKAGRLFQGLLKLQELGGHGHGATLAEKTLKAFEINLETPREHRELIVATIERLDRSLEDHPN
jgi:hypothetical protein